MSSGYHSPTSHHSFCTWVRRLYWKKLTYSGLWHMVWQHMFTLLAEVHHGTETRERAEVADQVRLVEVPALRGNCRPVQRGSFPYQLPRLVEPANAVIQLRCQADFGGEHLNEAPLAEADAPGDVADP